MNLLWKKGTIKQVLVGGPLIWGGEGGRRVGRGGLHVCEETRGLQRGTARSVGERIKEGSGAGESREGKDDGRRT